jgi:hypothetical protein
MAGSNRTPNDPKAQAKSSRAKREAIDRAQLSILNTLGQPAPFRKNIR